MAPNRQSVPPTIYLAGAIRDGRPEDIAWRQQVIEALSPLAVILSPLAGKTYSESTRVWKMSGIDSTAQRIVKHDFWMVDNADIVLANLTSLVEGYPSIGSLIELGRATANGALIYVILSPGFAGHDNAMYRLHPFLDQIAAAHFESVHVAVAFLTRHLTSLSGARPQFDGVQA